MSEIGQYLPVKKLFFQVFNFALLGEKTARNAASKFLLFLFFLCNMSIVERKKMYVFLTLLLVE